MMGDPKKTKEPDSGPKYMLILRGNSGPDYPDECGTSPATPPYEKGNDPDNKQPGKHFGALHDAAAKKYAVAAGYTDGIVLNVSGNSHPVFKNGKPVMVTDKEGNLKQLTTRDDADQTIAAVSKLKAEAFCKGIYGFSGGGYDVYYVLTQLAKDSPAVLNRIEDIVVVGVDNDAPKEKFNPKNPEFRVKGANPTWKVHHQLNREVDPSVVPAGAGEHMSGPESILKRDHSAFYDQLMTEEPYKSCQAAPPPPPRDTSGPSHKPAFAT